ncbi:AarF/UbiB family protein [Anaplasma platys]
MCLESLGPTFVKFGQSLAARVDIVGQDVAGNMLALCDKLPPFSYKEVKAIIEEQFRKEIHEIFPEFSEEPVAAASIAQVHRARALDGELKAVKVLRPGVEAAFARDINLMRKLAGICDLLGILKRFKLPQLIETFSSICKLELDLRFEAANADELRENLRNDSIDFYIPEVDWSLTSRRVLTLQWVEAIPIYRVEELKNREVLARKLIISFCNQVYRDRFFHADMHPGNLLVGHGDKIIAVDFGIVGRLDEETCFYITEIFVGFLNRDYKKVAEAHQEAGYIPGKCDEFITACRAIWEPIADVNAHSFSMAELLAKLFKITADFDMCVQPKLLLLQKTMVLVEGVCRQLAPDINFWKVAETWVKEHYEKDGYIERLKKTKACRSMSRAKLFMSKIDRCMDIMIENENLQRQRQAQSKLIVILALAVLSMFAAVILLK